MVIIPCRECAHAVSDSAKFCPSCGAPFPGRKEWHGSGIEWRTRMELLGYPLIHVAFGRDTKGRLRVAKGFIAIGQFAIGAFTIAQFGIGLVLGIGQFVAGTLSVGQFAVGAVGALGQFAAGFIAVGQFALGYYALCQVGWARYLWSVKHRNPEAVRFFQMLKQWLLNQ